MPNGRPGDNPLTDILSYGSSSFGEPVDSLVKKLSKHRQYRAFHDEIHNVLWDYWPSWQRGAKEGGASKAFELLQEIEKEMDGAKK